MTPFYKEVYAALSLIPKGKITTYGAIANYMGTKGVRAVATAVGKNPNAPEVPCHRVVPKTEKIGNYSGVGGIEAKIKLLEKEGIQTVDGKIVDYQKHLYLFEEHRS